jgi:hypothetical protein
VRGILLVLALLPGTALADDGTKATAYALLERRRSRKPRRRLSPKKAADEVLASAAKPRKK